MLVDRGRAVTGQPAQVPKPPMEEAGGRRIVSFIDQRSRVSDEDSGPLEVAVQIGGIGRAAA
jgi:hypothetical protein